MVTVYMTEIKTEGLGTARVANEVIAVIAGTAVLEVEGVAGLAKHLISDYTDRSARKHMARGVQVLVEGSNVRLNVDIIVSLNKKLQAVSREVQQRVKSAVETMTGLNVTEVNVAVTALAGEKHKKQ